MGFMKNNVATEINNHLPIGVDKIVTEFVEKIISVHSMFITGFYLIGSLPMNDFHDNKSDIDFIVLCDKLPDKKTFTQLLKIHRSIARRYPKPDLSGIYLTLHAIQTGNPENATVLCWHESSLRYGKFEMAAISLQELKTNAVTVYGQLANTLQIEVDPDHLKKFLYQNINSYWKRWIGQHSSFLSKKILLLCFPRFTEWSVLGVARQFYTLQTGEITSKTEAGNYCLQYLPEKFHSIIREAIKIRKDNRTYPLVRSYAIKPSFRRLKQTIECANYIIDAFNKVYNTMLQRAPHN